MFSSRSGVKGPPCSVFSDGRKILAFTSHALPPLSCGAACDLGSWSTPKPLVCALPIDRFAVLLVDEPIALLGDFLDRFQSLCQLELQLPSLRPEDLKNMVSSVTRLPWRGKMNTGRGTMEDHGKVAGLAVRKCWIAYVTLTLPLGLSALHGGC